MINKFQIGDKVVIINSGKIYSTYHKWATLHKLNDWKPTSEYNNHNGKEGTIICFGLHNNGINMLYGLQLNNQQLIIGEKGIERLVATTIITTTETKEPEKKFDGPFPTLREFLGI